MAYGTMQERKRDPIEVVANTSGDANLTFLVNDDGIVSVVVINEHRVAPLNFLCLPFILVACESMR